jgi:hypothetical protein
MAKQAIQNKKNPLAIKKLYVLGALEVERHRKLQTASKNNVILH